jgi:hypothetical protein
MSVRWDVPEGDLDPEFGDDIDMLLGHSPHAWAVTQGLRTKDEQADLYRKYLAGGPLAAPPGRSAHNWGLAVDVAALTPAGPSWSYDLPQWQWLYDACDAHPRLRSGYHFGDDDHIQAAKWIQKRVQLRQAGEW